MDQIEEKIEPMYSAEIKKEHVLEALQKLKAEGYSQHRKSEQDMYFES